MVIRPAWDDSLFDASLSNRSRPADKRTYFSSAAQGLRFWEKDRSNTQREFRQQLGGRRSSTNMRGSSACRQMPLSRWHICPMCGWAPSSESAEQPAMEEAVARFSPCARLEGPKSGAFASAPSAERPYLALSPEELVADFKKRRTEVSSSLSRGWTSPEAVRGLKQELEELQKDLKGLLGDEALDDASSDDDDDELHAKTQSKDAKAAPETPPSRSSGPVDFNMLTPQRPSPVAVKGKGKAKGMPPPPPPKADKKGKGKGGTASGHSRILLGRSLHWQALPAERIPGTVWSELKSDERVDARLLEYHFAKVPSKGRVVNPEDERSTPPQTEIHLLSRQRAQNIMITLRRRPLTPGVLKTLSDLDFEGDAYSAEDWELLLPAAPTAEESELLLAFTGDRNRLRSVEQQVLPLASMRDPVASKRMELLAFAHTSRGSVRCLLQSLDQFRIAYASLRASEALQKLLLKVRSFGNALNTASGQPWKRAIGFSLEVLPRLSQCRATTNGKVSFLHIVVAQFSSQHPHLIEKLLEDFEECCKAHKRPLNQQSDEVQSFRSTLASIVELSGGDTVEQSSAAACESVADEGFTDPQETDSPLKQLSRPLLDYARQLDEAMDLCRETTLDCLEYLGVLDKSPRSTPQNLSPSDLDQKAQEALTLFMKLYKDVKQCLLCEDLLGTSFPDSISTVSAEQCC
mmetsp:Transcript_55718/g.118688  ORF Transcript_55718/g.118688 Transcript_55718/m.118688 type:complete len:691 (-) Transcript_55718:301-2373(-)